jgi:hypothetical protein
VWLNVIGWTATAVFSSSYFFKEAATLRRIQAAAASLWVLYGVAIHSAAGGRRQPYRRHLCDLHFAAVDLEPPSGDESMMDLCGDITLPRGLLSESIDFLCWTLSTTVRHCTVTSLTCRCPRRPSGEARVDFSQH